MKRQLSYREIQTLRTAKTKAASSYGLGGLEKEHGKPKLITLRRADYDRQKAGQ